MKICEIATDWFPDSPGGLARYAYELSQELALSNAVSFWGTGFPSVSDKRELHLRNLSASDASTWKRLLRIWIWAQKSELHLFDAINFHFALYSFPFLLNLPEDVPVTFHFHGPWSLESEQEGASLLNVKLKKWVEAKVYRRCDRFVVLSQAFGNILHEQYQVPREKIYVIPGGVDTEQFQPTLEKSNARTQLGFPQNCPILFTPRRLVNRVGLLQLLQAIALIKHHVPDIWLAIAGKGPMRETLEHEVQALGLEHNVQFLGYLPDEKLPIAYQASDLTVVPSQALEGFGLILLESLSCGTPVLSTPVGGMPEVLRPLDKNLVTLDSSADAMANRILKFWQGELDLPSRKACRDYAVSNFDWKIIAPRVQDILLKPKVSN